MLIETSPLSVNNDESPFFACFDMIEVVEKTLTSLVPAFNGIEVRAMPLAVLQNPRLGEMKESKVLKLS